MPNSRAIAKNNRKTKKKVREKKLADALKQNIKLRKK
tara:strand:+ start:372 stop:482 length:111 start_codon:yes stop_codon:yes gene_type:complete